MPKPMETVITLTADVIRTADLVWMRHRLDTLFPADDIEWVDNPSRWRIKTRKGVLIIVNKKYAINPELIQGSYAIGWEESIF